MSIKFSYVLNRFLSLNGHKSFDPNILDIELASHPDSPSFKAITDTMDTLGVASLAASIPKDSFTQIKKPVLVSISIGNQSEIVLAVPEAKDKIRLIEGSGPKKTAMSLEDFFSIWDGSIIATESIVEKSSFNISKETMSTIIFGMAVMTTILLYGAQITTILFSLTNILGLIVTYLLLDLLTNEKSQGDKYCSSGQHYDCRDVINSKASEIITGVSLVDLTIIYFSGQYIALLLQVSMGTIAIVSTISLLVIPYSIYQQAFILKKWCPLCLGVSIILLTQFLLLVANLNFNLGVTSLVHWLISISIAIASWILVRPLISIKKDFLKSNKELRAFKRNYHLFLPYFNSVETIDTTIKAPDIILGGSNESLIKILVITNPLCQSCQKVHEMCLRLLNNYPGKIQVSLRFYVPDEFGEDPRTMVASGMIKAFLEMDTRRFEQTIDDWYKNNEIKPWLKKVGVDNLEPKFMNFLSLQKHWCLAHQIDVTPTILINNKRFPDFYAPLDLENLFEPLIEMEKSKEIMSVRDFEIQD